VFVIDIAGEHNGCCGVSSYPLSTHKEGSELQLLIPSASPFRNLQSLQPRRLEYSQFKGVSAGKCHHHGLIRHVIRTLSRCVRIEHCTSWLPRSATLVVDVNGLL
jgi:hypothetical protein